MITQLKAIISRPAKSSLPAWRDEYLDSKRARLEETTINNYKRIISLYINYVGEAHWPPTRFDVIEFLADVKNRTTQITAFSYWNILRGWFNYMAPLGAFGRFPNPALEIEELKLAPKCPKKRPKGIPEEQMDILFAYLRSLPDELINVRDLTLIQFLYRTGARAGEAAELTLPILQLKMNRVYVPAEVVKDDEDRELYFGENVRASLTVWLSRLVDCGYTGIWVFPSTQGHRLKDRALTVSGINQMFHRRLRAAGLPKYRTHDLRHTFTKVAMRQGISLPSIQKQLGHSTPDMVLWYAQAFSTDQEQEFINFGDDE